MGRNDPFCGQSGQDFYFNAFDRVCDIVAIRIVLAFYLLQLRRWLVDQMVTDTSAFQLPKSNIRRRIRTSQKVLLCHKTHI
jgi:hypothetical protein